MRKYFPAIMGVSVLLAVIVAWLGFVGLRARWDKIHGWNRATAQGFSRVTIGMTRNEVEQLMKSSGMKSDQFHLGQETGFERQYSEAKHSKSAYWLSWHNGIDYVYTVGFDDHDKATYKASGGT